MREMNIILYLVIIYYARRIFRNINIHYINFSMQKYYIISVRSRVTLSILIPTLCLVGSAGNVGGGHVVSSL